jgi:hypothetical protein
MIRDRARTIGVTFQLGATILCSRGIEDDRGWFARHIGRNHRIRKPIGGERGAGGAPPPGFIELIIVKQIRPGERVRAPCFWRRSAMVPLNSERNAAEMFEIAIDGHPQARALEQLIRECRG